MSRVTRFAAVAATISLLSPMYAFAATTTELSTEDVLENIMVDEPAVAVPAPMEQDSMGKGGAGMSIAPYYGGGGISVDATITKEVTPDFLAINAWCEVTEGANRQAVRQAINALYIKIKDAVGKDGRVRRSGVSVMPYYDPYVGKPTDSFTGTLNLLIRITNKQASNRIAELVEANNCTPNWDVRLIDTQKYEMSILDDLVTRLNQRKEIFEKLLKKSLTRVTSASLYTWVDGYSTYDPDTNTAEATTTLSVTFDIGGRAVLPTPTPVRVR